MNNILPAFCILCAFAAPAVAQVPAWAVAPEAGYEETVELGGVLEDLDRTRRQQPQNLELIYQTSASQTQASYEDDPYSSAPGHPGLVSLEPEEVTPLNIRDFYSGVAPHRWTLFGEVLFLSLRNTDTTYATTVDGGGTPVGDAGTLSYGYEPGFRIGGHWRMSESVSMKLTYWNYSNSASDTLTTGLDQLRADLVFPTTPNTNPASVTASADSEFDLNIVDLVYRRRVTPIAQNFSLNYQLGGRFVQMDQELNAEYILPATTTVDSVIEFSGGGPRVIIDAERIVGGRMISYFSIGSSFLMGQFDASYEQDNGAPQAAVEFSDNRIVPVLEAEVGVGYQSVSGMFRLKLGYHMSAWFNSVSHSSWIDGVQTNSLDDISETLFLDGLTASAEFRW